MIQKNHNADKEERFRLALLWLAILGSAAFVGAAIYGWIANVVDIAHMIDHPPITGMFLLRCVGVLVGPLGAVLGYV